MDLIETSESLRVAHLRSRANQDIDFRIKESNSKNMNQASESILNPELKNEIERIIYGIPLVKTLKIQLESLTPGQCQMSILRDGSLDGIFVTLHGGVMMALADTAACFAIQTIIGVEDTITTTDMNIRFLAPATGKVIAKASVIKAGRTLCPCEINLTDEKGKLLAIAQVTYMRLPKQNK